MSSDTMWEIPPHARRRVKSIKFEEFFKGNTSARAEKSPLQGQATHSRWEIPPHARRRGLLHTRPHRDYGNTSARAEKRTRTCGTAYSTRKYLRTRGEESHQRSINRRAMEIPPHARRREGLARVSCGDYGNTSARAEKRSTARVLGVISRKYLRTRGEEGRPEIPNQQGSEIPPHARRRGTHDPRHLWPHGNTSARAEKSEPVVNLSGRRGKYLRTRGEESRYGPATCATAEIPPHARRRGMSWTQIRQRIGNTSARAEKSPTLTRHA